MNKHLEELMRECGYAEPKLAERARELAKRVAEDCMQAYMEHDYYKAIAIILDRFVLEQK